MKKLLLLCILIMFSVNAQTYTGKVVKVKDGDTVAVLDSTKTVHNIRVAGVDAPEKNQDFGSVAKQFVSNQIFGKYVKVKIQTRDIYGREIAFIYYDNKSLSEELLKNGLAWHYTQYDKNKYLQFLEDNAKKQGVGLWIIINPVPPSKFRKQPH